MNLSEHLTAAAAVAGNRTALSCGTDTLSYSELDRKVTQLARGLQAADVRKGDRVALHMANTLDMALAYFACFRLGAVAVPINVRLKHAEIEHVLAHSAARLYLGEPGLYDGAPKASSVTELLAQGACAAAEPFPEVDGFDTAVILYTSGTTARPKGVTHSHDSTRCGALATIDTGYRSGDVLLSFCPLAHVSGLKLLFVAAVLLAAECALVPRFEAGAVLDTLERRRCTATFGLPVLLQALCREQRERPRDVSTLRTCLAGGDSVPLSLQQEFQHLFGCAIQEGIGMTEGVPICLNRPGRVRPGSVGEPALDVEVRIVDSSGAPVARGAVGELVFRAPAMMTGYWNEPAATAATIVDGWLHSGDLARQDPDGWYWFAGRKKEIIVRGGSNVAPQEVEDVLLQHVAVLEAGVVGVPDAEYGEAVVAFVTLRAASNCGENELIAFARQRLSDHKVPSRVHFRDALPLGNTGKVSRKSLKESLSL